MQYSVKSGSEKTLWQNFTLQQILHQSLIIMNASKDIQANDSRAQYVIEFCSIENINDGIISKHIYYVFLFLKLN